MAGYAARPFITPPAGGVCTVGEYNSPPWRILHQRARHTQADHALEAQVRAFLQAGEAVETTHYLAEA